MRDSDSRVWSVQVARALAASLVVCHHCLGQLVGVGVAGTAWKQLSCGVDVFFVISGFVMAMLVEQARETTGLEFIVRRLVRIVPLYWALTVAAIMQQIIVLHGVGDVASSFFFLPITAPDGGILVPCLSQGWTLTFEIAFYVLVSASLFVPVGALSRTAAVAAMLVAVYALDAALGGRVLWLHHYAYPAIFEFSIGGFLWHGFKYVPKRAGAILSPVSFLVGAAMVPGLAWDDAFHHGRADWAVAATLICVGLILSERFVPWSKARLVVLLGDASYELYLSHGFVLAALAQGLPSMLSLGIPPAIVAVGFVGVALASSSAVAALLHLRYERPLTKRLNAAVDGWFTPTTTAV